MPFRKDASGASATVDDLRHIALFARLSNAELKEIAELGEPVEAEAGAHLMEQGDVGTECFIVLAGEAGVLSGEDHVATIGPGSIVGEMALIGHRPRNASVVAQSPMRLLSFDIAAFRRLLDDMPQAQAYVHEQLEARARMNEGRTGA